LFDNKNGQQNQQGQNGVSGNPEDQSGNGANKDKGVNVFRCTEDCLYQGAYTSAETIVCSTAESIPHFERVK
jgi:hypothetical protein